MREAGDYVRAGWGLRLQKQDRFIRQRFDFFLDIVARPFYHSVVDLFSDNMQLDLVPVRAKREGGEIPPQPRYCKWLRKLSYRPLS